MKVNFLALSSKQQALSSKQALIIFGFLLQSLRN